MPGGWHEDKTTAQQLHLSGVLHTAQGAMTLATVAVAKNTNTVVCTNPQSPLPDRDTQNTKCTTRARSELSANGRTV